MKTNKTLKIVTRTRVMIFFLAFGLIISFSGIHNIDNAYNGKNTERMTGQTMYENNSVLSLVPLDYVYMQGMSMVIIGLGFITTAVITGYGVKL